MKRATPPPAPPPPPPSAAAPDAPALAPTGAATQRPPDEAAVTGARWGPGPAQPARAVGPRLAVVAVVLLDAGGEAGLGDVAAAAARAACRSSSPTRRARSSTAGRRDVHLLCPRLSLNVYDRAHDVATRGTDGAGALGVDAGRRAARVVGCGADPAGEELAVDAGPAPSSRRRALPAEALRPRGAAPALRRRGRRRRR